MSKQYPTAQLAVGGQPTVSGYDVISADAGFSEDRESYKNADGTHKVDVVFSVRRTLSLELQTHAGTSVAFYKGGTVDVGGITYCITDCKINTTKGPTMVSLELIEQAEALTATTTTTTTTTAA